MSEIKLEDAKVEKTQNSFSIYPDGSMQLTETHRVFQNDVYLGSYRCITAFSAGDPMPKITEAAVQKNRQAGVGKK